MTATQWRLAGNGSAEGDAHTDDTDDTVGARPRLPQSGRRRRRHALVAAIVVVLALFAAWLIAFSPVFGVGTVEVRGEHALSSASIERVADVDYGQPIVRVDTAELTRRVESLPQVESAQVSTSFPSTVVITVVERTAIGYVRIAGRTMLVDRSGVRYVGVEQAGDDAASVPPHLPLLRLPDDTDSTSTASDAPSAASDAVATVAGALPRDLLRRIRSIQALDAQSITLVFRGGLLVQWGGDDHNRQKAAVVAALSTRRPAPSHIDVTDPGRPFTD